MQIVSLEIQPRYPCWQRIRLAIQRLARCAALSRGSLCVKCTLQVLLARSKSIWLGGIRGFVIGIVLGLTWGKLAGMMLLPIVMTGIGLLLDYLLYRNYRQRKSIGRSTGWSRIWGGFQGGASRGW